MAQKHLDDARATLAAADALAAETRAVFDEAEQTRLDALAARDANTASITQATATINAGLIARNDARQTQRQARAALKTMNYADSLDMRATRDQAAAEVVRLTATIDAAIAARRDAHQRKTALAAALQTATKTATQAGLAARKAQLRANWAAGKLKAAESGF